MPTRADKKSRGETPNIKSLGGGTPPPQNIEAEMAVLGGMLVDGHWDQGIIERMMELLKPEYFYSGVNERLYAVMVEMKGEGRKIDMITVSDYLDSKGLLVTGGDSLSRGYIAHLANEKGIIENAEYYAGLIIEKAVLRRIIKDCTNAFHKAHEEKPFADIYEQIMRLLAATDQMLEVGTENLYEFLEDYQRLIRHASTVDDSDFKERTGLKTGYTNFDYESGGLFPGRLYGFAGRNKHGKTTWALNMGEGLLEKNVGLKILFVSLEMQAEDVMNKLISIRTSAVMGRDVPLRAIQSQSAFRTTDYVRDVGLNFGDGWIIDDRRGQKTEDIVRRIRRAVRLFPEIKVVIIDYMQKIVDPTGKRNYIHYENMCGALFNEAGLSKVAIYLLAQAGRGVARENRMPNDADIYGGDALDQYADQIDAIFDPYHGRPEDERGMAQDSLDRELNFRTLKNKYGPSIDWKVTLIPVTGLMYDHLKTDADISHRKDAQ